MEVWKDIPGYEGYYQASNLGRIKSMERFTKHNYGGLKKVPGKIMKLSMQRNGYIACPISVNGIEKRELVHRLVISAFCGINTLHVNHLNGIKTDNNIINLEYCTVSQNAKHAFKIGLSCIDGEKHPRSIFTNQAAFTIRQRALSGEKTSVLAKEFNVAPSTICNIKYGRAYRNTN